MAISIERMYRIYFPLKAYKSNNFKRMTKVSALVIVISLLHVIAELLLGFYIENFKERICMGTTVIGRMGRLFLNVSFAFCSFITLIMSMSWPENQGILFFYISKTLQMIRISFMASLLNAVL